MRAIYNIDDLACFVYFFERDDANKQIHRSITEPLPVIVVSRVLLVSYSKEKELV